MMRRRSMQVALVGALVGVTLSADARALEAQAADPPDIDGLLEAVTFYHENATSDLATMLEATRRLEAVAVAYPPFEERPDSWLPAYWTAFVYTQLALFADDARSPSYIRLALTYFEQASTMKPTGSDETDADFLALEGMILSFAQQHLPDEYERGVARPVWDRARAIDPDNPMGLMNAGLALIAPEETRAQAYEILDRAIEAYEPRLGTVRPNWGREFIDVWRGTYPLRERPSAATTAS